MLLLGQKTLAHFKISLNYTPGGPIPFLPLSFSFHSAVHIRKNQNYKKLIAYNSNRYSMELQLDNNSKNFLLVLLDNPYELLVCGHPTYNKVYLL